MPSTCTHPAEETFSVSSRRLEDADAPLLGGRQAADGGVVISLHGELDLATATVVDDELRRAESSNDLILLDLRGISFMDSTGLGTIIEADRRARVRDASLVILQGSPQVRRLFELAGVGNYLDVINDGAGRDHLDGKDPR